MNSASPAVMRFSYYLLLIVISVAFHRPAAARPDKTPPMDPCEKAARQIGVYDAYAEYRDNFTKKQQQFMHDFNAAFEKQNQLFTEIANDLIHSALPPAKKNAPPITFRDLMRSIVSYKYKLYFFPFVEAYAINKDGTRFVDQEAILTLDQLRQGVAIFNEKSPLMKSFPPTPPLPEGYTEISCLSTRRDTPVCHEYLFAKEPVSYFLNSRTAWNLNKLDTYHADVDKMRDLFKTVLSQRFNHVMVGQSEVKVFAKDKFLSDYLEFIFYNDSNPESPWNKDLALSQGWFGRLDINRDGIRFFLRLPGARFSPEMVKADEELGWSEINLLTEEKRLAQPEEFMANEILTLPQYLHRVKIMDNDSVLGKWRLEDAGCFKEFNSARK